MHARTASARRGRPRSGPTPKPRSLRSLRAPRPCRPRGEASPRQSPPLRRGGARIRSSCYLTSFRRNGRPLGFCLLSEIVRPVWRDIRRAPAPSTPNLRDAALAWSIATGIVDPSLMIPHGHRLDEELGESWVHVNVCALAIAARERLIVHALRPSIPRVVAETDVHSVPSEPPRLLRGPWIVEVRRPQQGERLFGETVSLGGYSHNGSIYLIGMTYPVGIWMSRWCPRWEGEEIEDGVRVQRSALLEDVTAHAQMTREAARFAVVLGLLLDAEGAPIQARDEADQSRCLRRSQGGADASGPWVTRHVTLRRGNAPADGEALSRVASGETSDRTVVAVTVRGHLKRQRHGRGSTLTKYVYIAGYSARRWVSPAPVRVVLARE